MDESKSSDPKKPAPRSLRRGQALLSKRVSSKQSVDTAKGKVDQVVPEEIEEKNAAKDDEPKQSQILPGNYETALESAHKSVDSQKEVELESPLPIDVGLEKTVQFDVPNTSALSDSNPSETKKETSAVAAASPRSLRRGSSFLRRTSIKPLADAQKEGNVNICNNIEVAPGQRQWSQRILSVNTQTSVVTVYVENDG